MFKVQAFTVQLRELGGFVLWSCGVQGFRFFFAHLSSRAASTLIHGCVYYRWP